MVGNTRDLEKMNGEGWFVKISDSGGVQGVGYQKRGGKHHTLVWGKEGEYRQGRFLGVFDSSKGGLLRPKYGAKKTEEKRGAGEEEANTTEEKGEKETEAKKG